MDEEALKQNTDCVYFLASPLTCKKGHECEYRHSESARINPRDCWFWLGGNCLNPRCPFRHPPLETHLAAQIPVLETSNKSRVPCYFFLQGFCAKGDKCAFTHGSHLGGNLGSSASQKQAMASITGMEPQAVEKKTSNISNNGSVENFSHLPSTPMEVEFPNDTDPVDHAVNQPSHAQAGQYITDTALPEIESTRVRMLDTPNNLLYKVNESHARKVQPTEVIMSNDEETEEWWEESSPGFDVLVDDGPEPVGYQEDAGYLSEPDMESEKGPSLTRGRTMHTTEEFVSFDYDNPSVFGHSGYFDEQIPYDFGAYDPCEHAYVCKQESTNLSDRRDGRVLHQRTRGLSIEWDRQGKNGDIYHCLAKRKRIDKGQIVGNCLGRPHTDTLLGDFHYGWRQQNNRHRRRLHAVLGQKLSHKALRHSNWRLHGRIFSGNCDVSRDLYHERQDGIKENPEKAQVHWRRFSNRLSGRFRVAPMESRDFKTRNVNKNKTIKDDTDFAGPKTLAQIREEKKRACLLDNGLDFHKSKGEPRNFAKAATLKSHIQTTYGLHGGERRMSMGKVIQAPSKLTDFEGPKPLSAILKAKRKAGSGTDSSLQIMLAEGQSQFVLKSESGENIDNSWVARKNGALLPASKKGVDEAETPLGGSNPSEASNHCQRRVDLESTNGAINSFEGNLSLQENSAALVREDDRVQKIITNGSNNMNLGKDVDHMMFHEIGEDKKAGEQMLEQDDDEFLEDDDEDNFAKKLGVLFT